MRPRRQAAKLAGDAILGECGLCRVFESQQYRQSYQMHLVCLVNPMFCSMGSPTRLPLRHAVHVLCCDASSVLVIFSCSTRYAAQTIAIGPWRLSSIPPVDQALETGASKNEMDNKKLARR